MSELLRSELFRDSGAAWAALLILILPLAIIGTGELEERLRQRDSDLRRSVSIVRTWVVPLFAAWAATQLLFRLPGDGFVVRLVASALVVSIGAAALSALATMVRGLANRDQSERRRAIPRLLLALPRVAILLTTAWVLVSSVWAVDLSRALTALGVTSLVISFALQGTLSGLASGFLLLTDQPFKPGDWIRSGDVEGRVVDVNWRSSRIENRDGDLVIIPNGELANATIVNFDEPSRLHRVIVPVQVAFVNSPTSAKEMLLAAAHATPNVLTDPEPLVRLVQVDDPLMGYEVHMWIDDYGVAPSVKSDFGSLVWYHSHRHGVPLPSPAQDLYLYDGVQAGLAGRPDHAEFVRLLRTSPLLAQVDDDVVDQLATGAADAQFAAGETIVAEGGRRHLQVLVRGTARLAIRRHDGRNGGDVTVLDLQPGDLFGLLDVSDGGDHDQVVVAVSDCGVVRLRPDAAAVVSHDADFSMALEQIALVRQRRVERVLRRLADPTEATS